jgi:hypothetical protein
MNSCKHKNESKQDLDKDFGNMQEMSNATYIDEENTKKSASTKLIKLIADTELFYDELGDVYATIKTNGHYETWVIESKQFQDWLSHSYWEKYKRALNRNSLQEALNTIQGKARFNGKCHKVFNRIGYDNTAIYINIADDEKHVIKITQEKWEILKSSPVKFKCSRNMMSLPLPQKNGNINELWSFINIPKQYQCLVLAWMLECLRPDTHFPILILTGSQGSAKSTTQEILRKLIDPSKSNLRSAPKKSEDMLVAAANNWLVSFNNLSHLTKAQQDDLCSLSTGGGFATRKLYTTAEEEVFDIKRPVILNGINDLVTAQDLIDRCICIDLLQITDNQRKTDAELKTEFSKAYPRIFGALLDILVLTLRQIPNVDLQKKPRMADFAILGVALERASGWKAGTFRSTYELNRKENITSVMEHSPVIIALTKYIEDNFNYEGTYSELYKILTDKYKPDMGGWPKSAKGLAQTIKCQMPALAIIDIEVVFDVRRKKDGYHIYIAKSEPKVHQAHQIHQISNNAELTDVHTHESSNKLTANSSKVHRQITQYQQPNEHNEHGELQKENDTYEDILTIF